VNHATVDQDLVHDEDSVVQLSMRCHVSQSHLQGCRGERLLVTIWSMSLSEYNLFWASSDV
jgi:hypothetical protein